MDSKQKKYGHILGRLDNERISTKLDNLKGFLIENRDHPQAYRIDYLRNRYVNKYAPGENLRRLFVNSLNAAGGDNLSLKGASARSFVNKVSHLEAPGKINAEDFFALFNRRISSVKELASFWIQKKTFKDFGKKKIALFVRDLYLIQTVFPYQKRIFRGLILDSNELIIPVDVVICEVLNACLRLKTPNRLNGVSDFDFVNELARHIYGDDYMLIEDLWYWGYFSLDKKRRVHFNRDKFYTDLYLEPTESAKDKFLEFISIIKA